MSKQLKQILERPVNLRGLIDKIAFEPETLEDAALEQPGLYLEASRYRTLKMRKRLAKELERDKVKAEVGLTQRRKKKEGERQTESAIKDIAALDPSFVLAQKALDQSEVEEELAKGLLEVFRQRLKVIEVLKDIRISEASPLIKKVRQEMASSHMRRAAEKARERYEATEDGDGE